MTAEDDELRAELRSVAARLEQVEHDLQATRSGPTAPSAAVAPPPPADPLLSPPPSSPAAAQQPRLPGHPGYPPVPEVPAPAAPTAQSTADRTESVLRWGGIVLVVLAAVFLVSAAASRGWIGPEVQWAIAMLSGIGLIGASVALVERSAPWSLALACGGVLTLGITAVAGHSGLSLYGSTVAGVLIALVAAIGVVLGIFSGRASLAALAAAVAMFGPLMLGESDGVASVAVWFSAVFAGGVALAGIMRWHSLRLSTLLIGAAAVVMVALSAVNGTDSDVRFALLMLAATTVSAVVAVSAWRNGEEAPDINPLLHRLTWPVLSAGLAAGLLFEGREHLWIFGAVVAAAVAAIAAGLHLTGAAESSAVGGLALSAMAIAAAGLFLSVGGAGLVAWSLVLLGWLALSTATIWAGWHLRDQFALAGGALLGSVCVVSTGFGIVLRYEVGPTLGTRFAHLAVLGALGAAAGLWRANRLSRILALAAWFGFLAWIGSALLQLPQGQLITSIVWAILGSALFVAGLVRKVDDPIRLGFTTLVFTVAKLFLIDLSEVDTLWRSLLFFVVGLGLLRLGMEVARRRARSEPAASGPSGAGVPAAAPVGVQPVVAAGPVGDPSTADPLMPVAPPASPVPPAP